MNRITFPLHSIVKWTNAVDFCRVKILRNFKIYLLVSCILINTWLVPLLFLDFEVRRDYIARVLCINQDQPVTVCGGKCYLNDRLKELIEHQETEAEGNLRPIAFSFFTQEVRTELEQPLASHQEKRVWPHDGQKRPKNFNQGLFRPPRN